MTFPTKEAEELLAACHRRCCICHRFCGVKIELDHIIPKLENGPDDIDNAIPVCFECHAEIHSYNDKHPRGRKFRPDGLKIHKTQWLKICREKPEMLMNAERRSDVGPLQALIDEMEFNAAISEYSESVPSPSLGGTFSDNQFQRAIQEGAIATLQPGLKDAINHAYAAMRHANQEISRAIASFSGPRSDLRNNAIDAARNSSCQIKGLIDIALTLLVGFLRSEE